jgi:TPR repeat protein
VPATDAEEFDKNQMERVKANDPAAMLQMGLTRFRFCDYDGAVEYFTKAAELGDMDAANKLVGLSLVREIGSREREKIRKIAAFSYAAKAIIIL